MATKKSASKAASTPTEPATGTSRLHITPLTADTFKSLLPRSLFPAGTEYPPPASFHTIETFPESAFGYVDVPSEVAEKVKKRLNGTVFRGSKIKVKDARKRKWDPEAVPEPVEEEVTEKKRKKNKKKEDGVYEGIDLPDGRWVKRAWTKVPVAGATTSSKDKASKDKSGKKKDHKKDETKRGDCLFKITLPDNVPGEGDDKKKKKIPEPVVYNSDDETTKKSTKKHKREKTLKEFSNTSKFPQFLKSSQLDPNNKSGKAAEFVEGVGWVDVNGQVVDSTVVKSVPKILPVDVKSPEKAVEPKKGKPTTAEDTESSEDSSESESDDESVAESDEEMKDAEEGSEADSESSSDSEEEEEEEGDDGESKVEDKAKIPDLQEATATPKPTITIPAKDPQSSDEPSNDSSDAEEDDGEASTASESVSGDSEASGDEESDEEMDDAATDVLVESQPLATTMPTASTATKPQSSPSPAKISAEDKDEESSSSSSESDASDGGEASDSDADSSAEESGDSDGESPGSSSEDEEEDEDKEEREEEDKENNPPANPTSTIKKPEPLAPLAVSTPTTITAQPSPAIKPTTPTLKLAIPTTTTTTKTTKSSAPHPLEALFKPTGAASAAPSTGWNLFNFVPDDSDDDDDEDAGDSGPQTTTTDAYTPTTLLQKRHRSAAPTPDTAVASKTIHWPEPTTTLPQKRTFDHPSTTTTASTLPFKKPLTSSSEAPLLLQSSTPSPYLHSLSIFHPGHLPVSKLLTQPPPNPSEEDLPDPLNPARKKRKGNANDLEIRKHRERKTGEGVGAVKGPGEGGVKEVWKEWFFGKRGEWNREWKNKRREVGKLERRKKGERVGAAGGAAAAEKI